MQVVKRDGSREPVDFSKIFTRLQRLASISPSLSSVDLSKVAQTVIGGVTDGIRTRDLDTLAAETAASYSTDDPAYDKLAARVVVSDLHKRTPASFVRVVERLHANTSRSSLGSETHAPLVSDDLLHTARRLEDRIDAATDHDRDYTFFGYFGIRTLLNGYLMTMDGDPIERPCHMAWRVAFGIHGGCDFERAHRTYRALVSGELTHASPTLFYAGTPRGSLSSCFLTSISEDSIESIYDTVKECAVISKSGGGIGIAVSRVRACGSIVKSTGRAANGILPALRVINETARHVTQGGRRKGAIAVYAEPHHADIFDIVAVRLNHGLESSRCRDLFPALWVSDLFMSRVRDDAMWTLFSSDTAPGLDDVWGEDYAVRYTDYERARLGVREVRARELWTAILTAQIETGTPYLLFKDTVNRSNAQANIGIIRNSNLCAEITLHASAEETAVCNLASIGLPSFVDEATYSFAFDRLRSTVSTLVDNLDAVIDRTHNPTPQTELSNARNRPIGIGVQGLADVFMALRMPFDSREARDLNIDIFETIYLAALDASCSLAAARGPYPTYKGSPASHGLLQPDLFMRGSYETSEYLDLQVRIQSPEWRAVRERIAKYGLRHSVLVACMPTASTAQLLGNTESFEPINSNLYVRRTLAGEFTMVNERLVNDLRALGLWDRQTRDAIVRADGSVQGLAAIPDDVKGLYRTVWEIPQKTVCEMAADRAPFIDQTQSLNIHMVNPTAQKLTSLHFHNHARGLKTSTYYVRTQAASAAIKFTLAPESRAETHHPVHQTPPVAVDECEADVCVMCSA